MQKIYLFPKSYLFCKIFFFFLIINSSVYLKQNNNSKKVNLSASLEDYLKNTYIFVQNKLSFNFFNKSRFDCSK